ncbi:flagellin [Priestia megaterium]|uniref:flagellin N-terminal helical domain-containing protein n=1 Tax=Priestia megaterium TaxID=1404 RepID=UPI00234F9A09|nr:flagellin [Priestia megaterium]MDC7723253.1 flagellin [Priestia megaterium]
MRINHNIAALNTYRQFNNANNAQGKSMEKLSSGLRINKAGDDAAGLAISEKMRGQVRGLDMASKNAQDGISMIATAEGALNETHDILQRMRELSVQSANDANTDGDRKNIQDEVDQLGKEVDRIRNTTQFNTKNLLDGTMDKGQATAVANVNSNTSVKTATASVLTDALTTLTDKNGNSLGITATDKIEVSYVKDGATVTNSFTAGALTVAALNTTDGTNADGNITVAADANKNLTVTAAAAGLDKAINGLTITVKDSSGNVRAGATNALSSFTETTAAANVNTDGQATFQIGANTGQNIQLAFKDMGTAALGIKDIKVGNQGQANVAVKAIDTAITKVSSERSKLGAFQNRLDHTINNLSTSSENLTAAESRIRDVDYALAA